MKSSKRFLLINIKLNYNIIFAFFLIITYILIDYLLLWTLKLFEDVVRKIRVNEALLPTYRNATTIEASGALERNVRKSLAEVYGDKFGERLGEEDEGGSSSMAEQTVKFKEKIFFRS